MREKNNSHSRPRRSLVVRKNHKERIAFGASCSMLGLLLLGLVFPFCGGHASAEGEPLTNDSKIKTSTYVYSTLAVSVSDSVNLDIIPKANGSFASNKAELKVSTNNTTGYSVYLRTGDNTSSLKPANGMIAAEIAAEIAPVEGTMTSTNYQTKLNSWGYAVGDQSASSDSLSYQAVPRSSDKAIITTDSLDADDTYSLGFAAAIDTNLPSGNYYNSVLVSVVANPIAVHTLSGITYMQEMSPYVCDYSDEHETKQLIDVRDGKKYWVAKLADGNCWMTQNLALDLDTNEAGNAVAVSGSGKMQELNSGNTDISNVWNRYVPTKTEVEIPENIAENYQTARSWNLGELVLINPTQSESCNDLSTSESLENCTQIKNVAGWKAAYNATETSAIDETNETYDAHYLIGNYYQWNTVNAGQNNGLASLIGSGTDPEKLLDATSSICPANWKLPTAGRNITSTAGWPFDREDSFYKVLHAYGYPKTGSLHDISTPAEGWYADSGNAAARITYAGATRLDYSPLFFVRAGRIATSDSETTLGRAGTNGLYWSSTANPNSNSWSFTLDFTNTSIYASSASTRLNGLPVRCLAR